MLLKQIALIDGGILVPTRDIEVKFSEIEGLYITTIDNPYVFSVAYTEAESLDGLCDQIASMWGLYAKENGDKLTRKARALKQELLSSFKCKRGLVLEQ